MAEELKIYGKTEEQLKNMNLDEFAELMPSRIRRSLKRGLTDQQKRLLLKLRKKGSAKTHVRDMIIIPEMIGKVVGIFNGKEFMNVEIKALMVGHYLGEFAMSRRRTLHSAPGLGATRSSKFVPLK